MGKSQQGGQPVRHFPPYRIPSKIFTIQLLYNPYFEALTTKKPFLNWLIYFISSYYYLTPDVGIWLENCAINHSNSLNAI